jgi:hypothetical protein
VQFFQIYLFVTRELQYAGVRKRVLNQAGASKGKQGVEQMQREFFRKRQKDEPLHHSEATVQDSIFEKLESMSNLRKNNEHVPNLMAKATAQSATSQVCNQTRPNLPLGKPITFQSIARKEEHPTPLKPGLKLKSNSANLEVPIQHAAPVMQHTKKPDKLLQDDETRGMQIRRNRQNEKPTPDQKPIVSQPAARKNEQPTHQPQLTLLKLQSFGLNSTDLHFKKPFQNAASAVQHIHKSSNSSTYKVSSSTISALQHDERRPADRLATATSLCIISDISEVEQNNFEDNTGKHSTVKNVFIDASTQCVFEPEFSGLEIENPYHSLHYKLPAAYSKLPRLWQYLLSQYVRSAAQIGVTLLTRNNDQNKAKQRQKQFLDPTQTSILG